MSNPSNSENRHPQTVMSAVSSHLPRPVIRGESLRPDEVPEGTFSVKTLKDGRHIFIAEPAPRIGTISNAAFTDWLSCTFPLEENSECIGRFIRSLGDVLGSQFGSMKERNRGLDGFRRSFLIGDSEALFAIGGQKGRAYLVMSGFACGLVEETKWPHLRALLDQRYQARVTRWDGAVDDFDGSHDIAWAIAQYHEGGFTTGGNKPKTKQAGDWVDSGDDGRTIYFGSRKNGKILRVYEKGKQLGNYLSNWVRWEIEFHNKDRHIPWDVVELPGPYVAGAFPCMGWINDNGPSCKIRTSKTAHRISYDRIVDIARTGYGCLIREMVEREGSAEAVIAKLSRPGTQRCLNVPLPDSQ